jgi:hypothetical protein
MGKDFVGTREYLFATKGKIDESQHWYGKSYPWTSGIDTRIGGKLETFCKVFNKVFKLLTWTTNWRSLRNYFWTTPCLRYRTEHLLIKTWSEKNGGKLYRRSLNNESKKVWKLLM